MQNLNPALKRIKLVMADGVERSPESLMGVLQMTGENCFAEWVDLYFVAHLAELERCPNNQLMLRKRKCPR